MEPAVNGIDARSARRVAVLLVSLAMGFVFGCGGSQEPTRAPERTASHSEESPSAPTADPEPAAPPAARRCTDGTCFACGSGYCPAGYFCDEGASGGAACSWLPVCAKSACACLKRALGSCTCDDGEGGAHVKCD